MKCVILAGGLGTRLSEETDAKPKPMVEIGGLPILWHIMKIYSAQGFHDFVICLGYRGYLVKEYFSNYVLHNSDVTFDLKNSQMEVHHNSAEDWKVTLVDTGHDTMTGGRIKRVQKYIQNESFFLTYGDGVSDVNLNDLLRFHRENKKMATVTAVQPPGRFGSLQLEADQRVGHFQEKPEGDGAWINGGFFVLEPDIFARIQDDQTIWEQEPLKELARDGQLMAFKHSGFWHAMDTVRDKKHLEELWKQPAPPWKVWS